MEDPKWKVACLTEFDSWLENDTFDVVDYPKTGKPIIVQLIPLLSFKKLLQSEDYLEKARFVGNGAEMAGMDPSREAFRLFLHTAVCKGHRIRQFDIRSAYLTARLPTGMIVYLRPFPGFEILCKDRNIKFKKGQLLRAKAAIYGLPQAGRAWGNHFEDFMNGLEMRPFASEGSLFYSKTPDRLCFTHVDDSLFSAEDSVLEDFTKAICSKFNTKIIGDIGSSGTQFLGMEISRPHLDTIFLSQKNYTIQIIEEANLGECKHVNTPAIMKKIGFIDSPLLNVKDHKEYRKINGELIYLLMTRNDIALAVNQVCRFSHAPTEEAKQAQRRIIRYLKGTTDHRLVYKKQTDKFFRIRLYTDSDWAGSADRSSTGGFMLFIGDSLIAFKCKTLKTANSSFDAESKTARLGVCEALAIHKVSNQILNVEPTMHVFIDNEGTVKTIKSGAVSTVNRYIGCRIKFLHHQENTGKILSIWIPTVEQLADIYTKPLVYGQLKKIFNKMPPCFDCKLYFKQHCNDCEVSIRKP